MQNIISTRNTNAAIIIAVSPSAYKIEHTIAVITADIDTTTTIKPTALNNFFKFIVSYFKLLLLITTAIYKQFLNKQNKRENFYALPIN